MNTERIRVRYAPSPTGFTHIGGLRTALYNELLARHTGGDFILRLEDTDRTRFIEGATENLCRSFQAMGVIPNEGIWLDEKGNIFQRGTFGPYIQSERKELHQAYAQKLLEMDKAYYCFCSAERLEELRNNQQLANQPTMYDGKCRTISPSEAQKRVTAGESCVIRLKLPKQGKIKIWDIIRDDIDFDWALIDDQVIIKSDGFPTYHLASTCDDHDMQISHVIRAEEWISSTPKHLFIYEAFGWTPPKFAHLPLLLNKDRSKLSKRQGDVAVEDYLNKGYLPEALLNFVALQGFNPSAEQEIYTHDELIRLFDLAKINKAGAVFNVEKLDWLNAHYLRSIPEERYLSLTHPFIEKLTDEHSFADRCLLLVRGRVQKPSDVAELTAFFFAKEFDFSKTSVVWKKQTPLEALERLQAVRTLLADALEVVFQDSASTEQAVKALIAEKGWGNGDTLWPLRVALSGQDKSPSPFELLWAYGKKRSLERIDAALAWLK